MHIGFGGDNIDTLFGSREQKKQERRRREQNRMNRHDRIWI
jgi:hypothetical protein